MRQLVLVVLFAIATTAAAACESKAPPPGQESRAAQNKAPEPPRPDPQQRDHSYAADTCNIYRTCYAEAGYNGQLTGSVTADVDPTGRLQGITYTGDAPKPVEQCILDRLAAHQIPDYVGGTGTLSCSWQGSLNNGIEMLSDSWGFARTTEPDGSPTPGAPPAPESSTHVAPQEPPPPPSPQERDDRYAARACSVYRACYKKFDYAGAVAGALTADVDDTGQLANPTFTGEAPKPIEQCMLDTLAATTLDDYVGGTGTLSCTWSGTIHGGIEMLSQSWSFERKSEPPTPGDDTP